MIFKTLIISLLLTIVGALTLLGLVMGIVKWKNPSKRRLWLIIFGISFLASASLSAYIVAEWWRTTSEAYQTTKEAFEKKWENIAREQALKEQEDAERQARQIALLKSMEPENLKREVPSSFYHYFGFRDWYRMPLPYPYSIACIDVVDDGILYDETHTADIAKSDDGAVATQLRNIRRLAFNKHVLLAEVEDGFDETIPYYTIFHFGENKLEEFESLDVLKMEAYKLGFDTLQPMMTLREYWDLF